MVSLARVLLGVFALLTVYIDPTQPTHNPELTYSLLIGYCLFGLFLAGVAVRFPPRRQMALVTHCVDVLFFSLLIYFTDGPTSPFFVYFTFALFSATLRWSWRGALATTGATVAIFVLVAVLADESLPEHLPRLILRVSYLIAAGLLFAYFGAAVEGARQRLAKLAAWPAAATSATRDPALESTLAHAASTMDIPRLLVVWEYALEPHLHTAEFRDGTTRFETTRGILSGFLAGTDRAIVLTPETQLSQPLRTWLNRRHIHNAVMAPIESRTLRGVVFFAADNRLGKELLPLARIAAMRIGAEIEQHNLRLRLMEAAAKEERARLARDIHDDLLQALAAVSLQLKALEQQVAVDLKERVAAMRSLLADQQGRLRQLVTDARRSQATRRTFSVAGEISELLQTAEAQWGCTADFSVRPKGLVVAERDGKALSMLVAEAIANGVRHGGASDFRIGIEAQGHTLTLSIEDNGTGAPALTGTFPHEQVMAARLGSASLRDRVTDLGWRIELSSSPDGLGIIIRASLE